MLGQGRDRNCRGDGFDLAPSGVDEHDLGVQDARVGGVVHRRDQHVRGQPAVGQRELDQGAGAGDPGRYLFWGWPRL